MRKARVFVEKEVSDVLRNRQVFWLYVLLPLLFTILTVGLIAGATLAVELGARVASDFTDWIAKVQQAMPELQGRPLPLAVATAFYRQVSLLFLLIPVALTTIAGAYSVVGEKTQKTLEPLLATPATDLELFLGKALGLLIPAVVVTTVAGLFVSLAVALFTYFHFGAALLPDVSWLLVLLVISPLVVFLGILTSLAISSRAADAQAAQQVAGLLTTPLILLFVLVFVRGLAVSPRLLGAFAWFLALLDFGVLCFVVGRFHREEILTRWK